MARRRARNRDRGERTAAQGEKAMTKRDAIKRLVKIIEEHLSTLTPARQREARREMHELALKKKRRPRKRKGVRK